MIHASAAGQACVHNRHTQKHKSWQRHLDTLRDTLSELCQGTSAELGSSSCCIILFGMLFLFLGSKLRRIAIGYPALHTHIPAGAVPSSVCHNHFRENSSWQMPQTKRGTLEAIKTSDSLTESIAFFSCVHTLEICCVRGRWPPAQFKDLLRLKGTYGNEIPFLFFGTHEWVYFVTKGTLFCENI